jgi:hypothetical protein
MQARHHGMCCSFCVDIGPPQWYSVAESGGGSIWMYLVQLHAELLIAEDPADQQ